MNKRKFSAFLVVFVLLMAIVSSGLAESYTVVEKIKVTEVVGITGSLGKNFKRTPYNNVLELYREGMDDDVYAGYALAVSADIGAQDSLWNFDIDNKDVAHVCYLGFADYDTAGMNDLIVAFCNKRGKFVIAMYNYTDHVLAYINDERFTEDEVQTIMKRTCFSWRSVKKKVLREEMTILRGLLKRAK